MQVLDSSRSDRDGATSVFGLVSLGQPSDLRDSMRLIDHGLQDSGSAGPLANAEAPPVPISAPTAARPAGEKSARGDGSALGLSALGLSPASAPGAAGDVSFKAPSFKAGGNEIRGSPPLESSDDEELQPPSSRYGSLPTKGKKQMKELNPKERAELAERRQATLGLNSWSASAGHREGSFRQKRPTRSSGSFEPGDGGSASFVQARVTPPGSPSGAVSSRLTGLSSAAGAALEETLSERRTPSLNLDEKSVLGAAGMLEPTAAAAAASGWERR